MIVQLSNSSAIHFSEIGDCMLSQVFSDVY